MLKNPLPLEASWRAEFISFFRMSKCIIFIHLPYTKFLRYHTKSIIDGSVLMSRIQKTFFRMSKCIIFMQLPYINFLRYYEKCWPLETLWWVEFRPLIRMSKFIIFIQPTYINFLKYSEKSCTVRNFITSWILITFLNIEVFYFVAAAIY